MPAKKVPHPNVVNQRPPRVSGMLNRARALTPEKVAVPLPPPVGSEDEMSGPLWEEQQVARTEILMTKGIRDPRQLMALLDIDKRHTMNRYIDRVHARWEMFGANNNLSRHRGEGLNRLDLIESEMWSLIHNTASDQVKIVTLRSIIEVHKERNLLLGLTQRVVERMSGTDGHAVTEFSTRVNDHDRMARLANRMLELLAERTGGPGDRAKVINHAS